MKGMFMAKEQSFPLQDVLSVLHRKNLSSTLDGVPKLLAFLLGMPELAHLRVGQMVVLHHAIQASDPPQTATSRSGCGHYTAEVREARGRPYLGGEDDRAARSHGQSAIAALAGSHRDT